MLIFAILLGSALIGGGSGCLTYLALEWRERRRQERAQIHQHQKLFANALAIMLHTERRAYDTSIADVVAVTGRSVFKTGPNRAHWTDDQEHWHR